MRIQHNISAMNTQRQLGVNNTNTSKSLEKLSSGYRINRAGDDAAGLAISEKMRAQIRGLNRASENAQDGVSLIQAAEGALQETHSILQRMRELAVQAANDVNEVEDRDAIQAELDALTKEVDRIANTTEFNKKTLLDGSLSNSVYGKIGTGVGYSAPGVTSVTQTGNYSVSVASTDVAVKQEWTLVLTDDVVGDDTFTFADLGGAGTSNVFTVTASQYDTTDATGAVATDELGNALVSWLNGQSSSLYTAAYDAGTNTVSLVAKDAGAVTGTVSVADASGANDNLNGADFADFVTGVDATFTVSGTALDGSAVTPLNATYDKTSQILTLDNGTSAVLTLKVEDWTQASGADIIVKKGSELTLQVGANTGSSQTIAISVDSLSAKSLGIDQLKVNNHKNSQVAIDAIESSIQKVSEQRSALGALQNRLEHVVTNLDTVSENLQSAEARIRDVDMAKEMMNFTKNNILMQAAQAMLAQANALPQGVLQLLQ